MGATESNLSTSSPSPFPSTSSIPAPFSRHPPPSALLSPRSLSSKHHPSQQKLNSTKFLQQQRRERQKKAGRAASDGQVYYYPVQDKLTKLDHHSSVHSNQSISSNVISIPSSPSSSSVSSRTSNSSGSSSTTSSACTSPMCGPLSPSSDRSCHSVSSSSCLHHLQSRCNNCNATTCSPAVSVSDLNLSFCSKDCYWSYSFRFPEQMIGNEDVEQEYQEEEETEGGDWYTEFRKQRVKLSSSIAEEEISVPEIIKTRSSAVMNIRRVQRVLPPLHD